MQAQKISHFYPNLFISLTYILAFGSTEVKQEEESGSAAKKPKSLGRKFKGKDKRKVTFSVDKISLQTWRTLNLSPRIDFFCDKLLLTHNQLYPH